MVLSRGIELVLGLYGLGFTIFGSESQAAQAKFLASWGAVALVYLIVGGIRVRRLRLVEAAASEPPSIAKRRIGFLLTVAASLTGLGAALGVLSARQDNDY